MEVSVRTCCTIMSRSAAVVFVVSALVIYSLPHDLINCISTFMFENRTDKLREDADIVIGVLSARENVAQRRAVRETWGSGHLRTHHAGQREKALVKFIVGGRGCDVPPEVRENSYSCESIAINDSAVNFTQEMVAFQTVHRNNKSAKIIASTGGRYFGVDFKVNYPIIAQKLGTYDNIGSGLLQQGLVVTLYDTWTQEPVVSVTFSPDSAGVLHNGIRYKEVAAYLLPKDFQGTLVTGTNLTQEMASSWTFQHPTISTSNIVSIQSITRSAITNTFPGKIDLTSIAHTTANFIFKLHNPAEVERAANNRWKTEQSHAALQNKMADSLLDEQRTFKDILFVDEIDTYRNIPKKMLHFFSWVSRKTSAKFVIKTDDDCFVDVDAIISALAVEENSRSWWGSFRLNWPPDVLGKWAEHKYPSPVYPAFACGSGSLLTRDLVEWIGQNAPHLHSYQGEDVSMGIWMAAVLPTYIDDPRWQCDGTCHKDAFVLPQLFPDEMRTMWQNWENCRNPCGCTST